MTTILTSIYHLIVVPFWGMVLKVASFIPTLFSAVLLLILGVVVAKLFKDVFHRILSELHFDHLAEKVGLSGLLHKGGIRTSLVDLIGTMVHMIVIFIFLIMAVEVMGLSSINTLMGYMVTYVPQVISAMFILVVGMIIAKIMGGVIYTVAMNLSMPNPKILKSISRWAILIYAFRISLEELGYGMLFEGHLFHLVLGGVVLALALAFGLGGRDKAAEYMAGKK